VSQGPPETGPALRWHDAGRPEDLRFMPGAPLRLGDRWIAIFRIGDGYTALDNACPHAGAPLCDGRVVDGKIVCYLHLWSFDLRTGSCDVGPDWNVTIYPVRLHEGRLLVGLPA
jgi:nitrite reductase/ring-hydroxylating ferredoxin subunit